MYYTINYTALWPLIDEEVSRVADNSYTEQGVSQYDLIHLTSRDRDTVQRLIDDAVSKIVAREGDICKYAPQAIINGNDTTVVARLLFYVPDMDTSSEGEVTKELTRYIVFYVTASHLGEKRPERAQQYITLAQSALDKAVILLKTRKSPTESWS